MWKVPNTVSILKAENQRFDSPLCKRHWIHTSCMRGKELLCHFTDRQEWEVPGPDRDLLAALAIGELSRRAITMGAFGLVKLGRILLLSIVTVMWNLYILLEELEFLRHLLGKLVAQSLKKAQTPFIRRVSHCYTWLS